MRDDLLSKFLDAPDGQLDEEAKKHIPGLIGLSDEEVRKPLLFMLDDCVYHAWGSSFSIKTLDLLYRMAGGNESHMESLKEERKARHEEP